LYPFSEAIDCLRRAGIVVWVLTGDKQETAINIAYSCRLFAQDMDVIKLNARSRDAAETTIRYYLDHIKQEEDEGGSVITATEELSDVGGEGGAKSTKNRALVIDGKTLIYILDRRAKLQVRVESTMKMGTCGAADENCSCRLEKSCSVNEID
jgi:phospholipid-translocating ATPase